MGFFSKFLPKRKPVEIKNNVPKEKENIKTTFAVYCHKNHNTSGEALCPKCTALLATIMIKMSRCPYGITKPICDRCDRPCFGAKQTKEFLEIMNSSQKHMLLSHPIMTVKHKLASMGVDYAKYQQQKKSDDKTKAKEKSAKERKEKKGKGKKK
ncbi:MAG: nitrous oxide-stimulated promoter family protein [Selenomonadaceae bacterium]|nr:nitrous oxide-stimulated promoter family protein [Selenomonadaceae bacterium]